VRYFYPNIFNDYILFAVQCSSADGAKVDPTAYSLAVYEIDGSVSTIAGTAITGSPFTPAQLEAKTGLWAVKIAKTAFTVDKQYLFIWEMTVDGVSAAKQEIWCAVNTTSFMTDTTGLSTFDPASDSVIVDFTGVAMQTDIADSEDTLLTAISNATKGLSTFDPVTDTVIADLTGVAMQADLQGIAMQTDLEGIAMQADLIGVAMQTDIADSEDTLLTAISNATKGLSTFDPVTDTVIADLTGVAMQADLEGVAMQADLIGVAMQTDIQAHQEYMVTTLSGLQTTVSNISNVVRLNVAIPNEVPIPETGYVVVRCDIALHDSDGNMEDPDDNYLTINFFDIYENSMTDMLFQDSTATTPLASVPSGDLIGRLYAVRQETGLYTLYIKVVSEVSPKQLIMKFRWQENGTMLYEFKSIQLVDVPSLSDIQTGLLAIKERTDNLPDDPAGITDIESALVVATSGLSVFDSTVNLVRVGYIRDEAVTSTQDFMPSQGSSVDLSPVLDRLPVNTPDLLVNLDMPISDIAEDIEALGAMIQGKGIYLVTFSVVDSEGSSVPNFVISIRQAGTSTDLIPRLSSGIDGLAYASLEAGSYYVQAWRAGWGVVAQEITVLADTTIVLTATPASGVAPTPVNPYHCLCYISLAENTKASGRIINLPYAHDGIYQNGDEVVGVWDEESSLMTWEMPWGATVQFSIPTYQIFVVQEIPTTDSFKIM